MLVTQRQPRRDLRNERGAVLIMAAGMIVVLMGFVGLGLDTGSLFNHKRVLQTAADAGALHGAYEIFRGNTSLVTSAALTGSADNGYQHGTYGVTVEVYNPPITGYYVGDNAAVEVVVRQPSPITFMTLFGFTPPTIPARAVAWAGANSKRCIHVLEDYDQDAFAYDSSAVLNAQQCDLVVNSSDSWSGHLTSNSDVNVANATFTGGYIEESSSDLETTSGYGPYTDAWPRAPDPLGFLNPPPVGGCDYVDWEIDQPTITLNPGVYCGKFTLKNATHATLTPGIYVMVGGPMRIEGDSIMQGDDVMLYFTDDPSYPFLPFSWSSNAQALLTAQDFDPTFDCRTPPANLLIGCYGILFYQDPNAGDEDDEHRFESNTGTHILNGAMYFPTQVLVFESSTVVQSDYLIIVARVVRGESNSVVNMGTILPGGTSPLKRVALVE